MRQLLADLKGREPLGLSVRAWWAREGTGVLVGVVIVLLCWVGYQQVQLWGVSNHASSASQRASVASQHASVTASISCESSKLVAEIASETLATQIKNSQTLLPKISFPGLTHPQLIKLTQEKEQQERRHLAQLNQVAQRACPGTKAARPSPLWPILPKPKS